MNVTIQNIVDNYGLSPTRAGFIPCPVHEEKEPSCQLHDDWWYCFGCGANGDAFGLLAAVTGRPIGDILREHAQGVPSWRQRSQATKHIRQRDLKENVKRAFRELHNWFFAELSQRLHAAPDWLLERAILYWGEVFDEAKHRILGNENGFSAKEAEAQLAALQALIERGLDTEDKLYWQTLEGEVALRQNILEESPRDRRPK